MLKKSVRYLASNIRFQLASLIALASLAILRGHAIPIREDVVYVPKRDSENPKPWIKYGATRDQYEQWVPHTCGICCLKTVGDTLGKTNGMTLYDLTMECLQLGGFRAMPNGEILGVYHHPLAQLARDLGMNAKVRNALPSSAIINEVQRGHFVILSVDLSKLGSKLDGGHLVTIYGYDRSTDEFILHDSSSVLKPNGNGVHIKRAELNRLSNRRGLVIKQPS